MMNVLQKGPTNTQRVLHLIMVCLVSLCHQAHVTELLHAGLFSVAQVAEFKVRREIRVVSHVHYSDVSAVVYVMWWFMQGLDVGYETVMSPDGEAAAQSQWEWL